MLHVQSFRFNAFQENTYLLYNDQRQAILIDPGCSNATEEQALMDFATKQGLEVSAILLTHAHIDHILGLKKMSVRWNVSPVAHTNEKNILALATTHAETYGLPYEAYEGTIHWVDNHTDRLDVSLGEIRLLHTPGHSPGSVCFYFENEHLLLGGDVLFFESIGRTDLPGGHHQTLLDSISTQLFPLPEETTVYPGHGRPTTIGYEKKHNPFLSQN